MQDVTNEFIRILAAANGLTFPDERLDLVRRQYESFLRVLAEIGTLALPREVEPAVLPVVPASVEPADERAR